MTTQRYLATLLVWTAAVAFPAALPAQETIGPSEGYQAVAELLEGMIRHEMEDKKLPAASIVLVDGREIVWAAGFGLADRQRGTRATAETVYRVGSVSKLFTDIAVMQLVEQGKLDLDAPVTDYLPDFRPQDPFGKPITLRQLMCHRAGLVREPPVGSYFDPGEPSLAETVESLNRTALVYEPGTRTKYSNAGIAVVGYVLEQVQNEPFAAYVERAVLGPLGARASSFEATPDVAARLAKAVMWTYDGREFEAPAFGLGTAPAGNLYANVLDLGKLLAALVNEDGGLLKPETLGAMYTPQFADGESKSDFGLGFHVGELEGHRRVGHGGAVYGFATELAALPDARLGVAAVTSRDCANAVTRRIAEAALRLLLARRAGKPLEAPSVSDPIPPERIRQLVGRYASGDETVQLSESNGRLLIERGDFVANVRALGNGLTIDDPLVYGPAISLGTEGGLSIGDRSFSRLPNTRPEPPPADWLGLVGEYGWDHNTLYIVEHHGRLHALIEWFFNYPLKEAGRDVFEFPNHGMYHGERLVFTRDAAGQATQVEAAGIVFARRPTEAAGKTFKIAPVRPVEELRGEALAAQPPQETGDFEEADLVEPAKLDPSIRLDIRYATTNNFMGAVFYDEPKSLLQRPAAEALVRVHRRLASQGYGLLIHDAYRPWYVTRMFWEATPPGMKHFVADPAKGSRHNRGAAVDLTLYELASGAAVEMPSGYDEFSPRAYPRYPGGTSLARWHRELLREAMESEGFSVYEFEWWHFDYRDWQRYPILNIRF
ncbi:MAG: serine hydrolase [Pirellulales bacterium]